MPHPAGSFSGEGSGVGMGITKSFCDDREPLLCLLGRDGAGGHALVVSKGPDACQSDSGGTLLFHFLEAEREELSLCIIAWECVPERLICHGQAHDGCGFDVMR